MLQRHEKQPKNQWMSPCFSQNSRPDHGNPKEWAESVGGNLQRFSSVSRSLPPTPNHFPAYCASRSICSGQEVWQPHCPPSHAACEFHPCVNAAGRQPSTRMQQINKPRQSKQREQILERVTRHPAKSYNYPKEKKCDKLGAKWLLCQHKAVWSHKTLFNTVFLLQGIFSQGHLTCNCCSSDMWSISELAARAHLWSLVFQSSSLDKKAALLN